mgnify:CR=1 FL=1
MKKEFKEAIEDSPIIAAIKDDDGLKKCLTSESRVIFILYGDICNIPDIVETVKSSGKIAMVHIDLITGLSSKEIAVDFIKKVYTGRRDHHHKTCSDQTCKGVRIVYNPSAVCH